MCVGGVCVPYIYPLHTHILPHYTHTSCTTLSSSVAISFLRGFRHECAHRWSNDSFLNRRTIPFSVSSSWPHLPFRLWVKWDVPWIYQLWRCQVYGVNVIQRPPSSIGQIFPSVRSFSVVNSCLLRSSQFQPENLYTFRLLLCYWTKAKQDTSSCSARTWLCASVSNNYFDNDGAIVLGNSGHHRGVPIILIVDSKKIKLLIQHHDLDRVFSGIDLFYMVKIHLHLQGVT